jgi:Rieske Fe-S protein
MAVDDKTSSETSSAEDAPESPERRRFLGTAAAALGVCAGGLVTFPVLGAVVSPAGRRTVQSSSAPVDVGADSDFTVNQPRRVVLRGNIQDGWETADVELGAAWVTKHADGKWTAFSSICPHLGCAVDHVDGPDPFFCPCHSSYFTGDGAVKEGPSPRGLDALPVSVADGRVRVEFHRYVLNQKSQVEA